MNITIEQLKEIAPNVKKAELYIDPLNAAMDEGQINTPLRIAAFLGQILHETNQFLWMKELASGKEYEHRQDLGNTQSGDGVKYKGRGAIQLTGRSNYQQCGEELGIDLINSPELAEQPDMVFKVAVWFWSKHGLNDLADKENIALITRKINGGTNGYSERLMYTNRAKQVLGASSCNQ